MKKIISIFLCLIFVFALFGCDSERIDEKAKNSENIEKISDSYDGYMQVSELDELSYASNEILVRYGGVLYGRSNGIIDVASTIKKVGIIDKVIDKEYVPKYDSETNCEEIRNAGVYGEPGESLILFYDNEFTLFEKIESSDIDFKAQYVRTFGYSDNEQYPKYLWIESKDGLEDYISQNKDSCTSEFSESVKKYDESFFRNSNLIMIILQEGSGSVRHEVTRVRYFYSGLDEIMYSVQPEIRRIVPEVQTCDMAQWHIIIEVGKEYGKDTACLKSPVIK